MARVHLALHIIIILCVAQSTRSDLNPDWEEPDAFSQRKPLTSVKTVSLNEANTPKCQEPVNTNTIDNYLPPLYKKLVKFLLKRESMKFDKSSRIFYRSLHLHITEEQMIRFDEMTDVHDMDQLIAEVFYQSRSGTYELFQEMYLTWKDIFVLNWEWIMSSRQVVIAIQFSGFVLIWFASRKFKFRLSVVGFFFVLFYLYSFLDSECHRKKEIEKTAQMFGMKQENPCNTTSFWSYYFRNQNEDCKKYLDNSYDVSCTLIDVYEEFINVFLYKQMWNFIDNSVANILKVYASYGIIGALAVTAICIFLFNNYVKLIIKSLFHYLFTPRSSSRFAQQQIITGAGDTISSEVLNKILDITRDQTKLNALHLTRITANSGVQQIDVVDGNESADSETINVLEVESVQMITATIVSTDSLESTCDDKLTHDSQS